MAQPEDDIPVALEAPRRRWWSAAQAIWLLPLLAVGVVLWLALHEWMQAGPTITIRFRSAEGIEAGKTRVKYREVDLGVVKQVRLAPDRKGVLVVAQMTGDARPLLVDDTRFWIVRARLTGGELSGLSTLLSGSYIGIDGGKSETSRREFEGLETPPVLNSDESGREFKLTASSLGSLEIGSPIFLRRVRVGQVLSTELDPDGRSLTLRIFIRAPHDRLVTANTRFWHASGLDVSVDANGVRLRTESLLAVVVGGISFETPGDSSTRPPASPGATFTLFDTQATALRRPEWQTVDYTATFGDSVRGLQVGAPVEFKGFVIGEVAAVDIEFDRAVSRFVFPVKLRIYRDLAARASARGTPVTGDGNRFPMEQLLSPRSVERGLRAQLRSSNLLTGQRYVAIDFFPELRGEKLAHLAPGGPREIPTARDSFGELEASVSRIVKRLESVPFDKVAADLQRTLASLDRAVNTTEQTVQRLGAELIPSAKAVLDDARRAIQDARTLAAQSEPIPQQASEALRDLGRAADALRDLAEAIERQPESLLRGKRTTPAETSR
jgi:paraquat-inducible protein B